MKGPAGGAAGGGAGSGCGAATTGGGWMVGGLEAGSTAGAGAAATARDTGWAGASLRVASRDAGDDAACGGWGAGVAAATVDVGALSRAPSASEEGGAAAGGAARMGAGGVGAGRASSIRNKAAAPPTPTAAAAISGVSRGLRGARLARAVRIGATKGVTTRGSASSAAIGAGFVATSAWDRTSGGEPPRPRRPAVGREHGRRRDAAQASAVRSRSDGPQASAQRPDGGASPEPVPAQRLEPPRDRARDQRGLWRSLRRSAQADRRLWHPRPGGCPWRTDWIRRSGRLSCRLPVAATHSRSTSALI